MSQPTKQNYSTGLTNMYGGQTSPTPENANLLWKFNQNQGQDLNGQQGLALSGQPSGDAMFKQMMMQQMQPIEAPKFGDISSMGDFGSWMTSPTSGTVGNPGKTPLEFGLAGLGVGSQIYSAYNSNKYQNKMAGLAERQQSVYESELAAQNARRDRAQSNYDAAQIG